MANKVTLLWAIHNHQPVGNFDHVLEEAYTKSYIAFLQLLQENPHMRLTLHYSGFLLEWLLRHHPECIALIRELTERKQTEIMTGGFYEPILTTLYDSDKVGQIEKLNRFIRENFGTAPKGVWLAERVWEPHLAEPLHNAGTDYVILDDHHFIMAGLREKSLHGYYMTEEKGRIIRVFPGSKRLRYLIPFRPVEETLSYLADLRDSHESPLAIMGDDGEKFGVWPGTYKSVYLEGWLQRFFHAIHDNRDWIDVKHFSEVLKTHAPRGRIYLPTCSYVEMSEWSLLHDASGSFAHLKQQLKEAGLEELSEPFVSGGFWRNFFSKYPESNLMHKKMLHVSNKVHHLPEGEAKYRALDELWKGQCNDAYWHGVFGGLYLPHLRSSVYEHLIRAETIADHTRHHGESAWVEASIFDLDKDGQDDVVIETETYTVTVNPAGGGNIVGLDFRPRCFNLQDTFTRIRESYHKDIVNAPTPAQTTGETKTIHDRVVAKEAGLADQIVYDPYPRRSLIDHFLESATTLDGFCRAGHREMGDFVQGVYEAEVMTVAGEGTAILQRQGEVHLRSDRSLPCPVKIKKILRARQGSPILQVAYTLENLGDTILAGRFGIEMNLTLLAGNAPDRYYVVDGQRPKDGTLISAGETRDTSSIELRDEWNGLSVQISTDRAALLWRFPIESVSMSEGGFEKIYQSSCMLFLWDMDMAPRRVEELNLAFSFQTVPGHGDREGETETVQSMTEP
ncbi:MAG: alpha-amylase/4-alpha-glucanotransferase domain-containing protein [bacterium]|nr:alpha-amylase/4-alpha-glucanotransferase domain-containing protein [bacterium]